jgi:ATP-binding protein involved in chromosome partitioning
MLGVNEPPQISADEKIQPVNAQGVSVVSMGLMVPPHQPVIWRGPMVFSAIRQFLRDVAWGELDFLVVDLPPGTGDAQLTLVQQVLLSGIVMVTTPQEVALADVRRGVMMFRSVDVPVLGVVENMSYFRCPDTGKEYDIFGRGGGARVAAQFRLPLLAEIPIDPAIREGGDAGRPAVAQGEGPVRDAFLKLADEVVARAVAPAS